MKQLIPVIVGLLIAVFQPLAAAESYLVMESHSGKVLLAANPEQKRPIASLTKMVTSKVVLDWARVSQTNLSTIITVPPTALSFGGRNPMGLRPGDRMTLRNAIYSAMMGSDNIAAYAMADYVGRSLLAKRGRSGDPQNEFVAEMNHLAKALRMRKTRFVNPHGLELPGKKAYSTASDMARMSVHAMRDVGFAFYVKQKSRSIDVIGVDGSKRAFKVSNTNSLLGAMGVNGIKTGFTAAAGQCIAINSHRRPLVKKIDDTRSQIRKRDLIVVILGSADRIGRPKQLISQAWPLYDQWAASGYPVSPKGKELIIVPQLR
ncbi:MAG: serine hydrolase [Verrucomicrobiae bacterium]|nr:serine hydrolase [Verrucomicrobiae bacterium]NNJ87730.1 D-alanyl-D-alanine carboxypeptidase [Akkermansiaceae bacterium]